MTLEPYTILKNKHVGETAFVLGAGTSLLGLINHPKSLSIFKHVVISVNSSILAVPWCGRQGDPEVEGKDKRYWISNDALCRRWSWWKDVKKADAIRLVRDSWKPHYHELEGFLYFWPRPTSEGVIKPTDEGLSYCSSVPSGIDLAIQMGCKRVVLLGVDQYMIGDKSHFWQFWPREKWPRRTDFTMATHSQQKAVFDFNDIAYPALKRFADVSGVTILNANPQSKVEAFEKITLDEALESICQK